jgi:hypothetical protein
VVEVAVVLVLDGLVLWFMPLVLEEVVPIELAPEFEEAVSLPLQESEIMLTDVTCIAPPLDCVPCTST